MKIKNGIMLAGGKGTRLAPHTQFCSKQLISIDSKPLIEYPINTLKQMGVENLTIIVGSSFSGQILDYIKDGSQYGLNINYIYQPNADGISSAIYLCKRFVADSDQFVVILGDNYYSEPIDWHSSNNAQIVLYNHKELQRFGVASIKNNQIAHIEEKPVYLQSDYENYAITGCYIFNQKFFEYFKQTKPSTRGEWEITEIIYKYLIDQQLDFSFFNGHWFDVGTHKAVEDINRYILKCKLIN